MKGVMIKITTERMISMIGFSSVFTSLRRRIASLDSVVALPFLGAMLAEGSKCHEIIPGRVPRRRLLSELSEALVKLRFFPKSGSKLLL